MHAKKMIGTDNSDNKDQSICVTHVTGRYLFPLCFDNKNH